MIEHGEEKREEKTKTILVVDDEMGPRESLRMILKPLYNVFVAEDGESGLNEYKKLKPDLISIDLKMPGMDGITLLRHIREKDFFTPVIIITGFGTLKSAIEAVKLGVDDYVAKPFHVPEILHIIEDIIFMNNSERVARRFRSALHFFREENDTLRDRLDQIERMGKQVGWLRSLLPHWLTGDYPDKYKSICGAVAHSLKGEFLLIGNSIKGLRELIGPSPEIQEECDVVERSVAYSQNLLRRLLDYLDLGKPQVEPVKVLELIRKIEFLVRPRLPSSISFQITIDHSREEWIVSANNEQLIGILLELIDNAVSVLREKGGTIELLLEGRDGEIGISVKDDGPGIPGKLRKKLFKNQVSSRGGLGLGLFLCNRVLRELGGKLNLQTSSEEGTTFTILLPMANDKKEP